MIKRTRKQTAAEQDGKNPIDSRTPGSHHLWLGRHQHSDCIVRSVKHNSGVWPENRSDAKEEKDDPKDTTANLNSAKTLHSNTQANDPAQAGRASDVRLPTETLTRPCPEPDG
jgi:hypothetical protein